MRGFWHSLALIAEDASSFNNDLFAVCRYVKDPDLLDDVSLTRNPKDKRKVSLSCQPAKATLVSLDKYLRASQGLVLFPYELAELNRVVYEAVGNQKVKEPHSSLKSYWRGLGELATKNRSSAHFMQAVGALSSDGWATAKFVQDEISLTPWFHLTPDQEAGLRSALYVGGPAFQGAEDYREESWPTGGCGSILMPSDNWLHLNM